MYGKPTATRKRKSLYRLRLRQPFLGVQKSARALYTPQDSSFGPILALEPTSPIMRDDQRRTE